MELFPTDPSPNALRFTGQEEDASTGNLNLHFRFYQDAIGRFLKPDNIPGNLGNPQSWNRYSYCNGNPVNFRDPTGHAPMHPGGFGWGNQAYKFGEGFMGYCGSGHFIGAGSTLTQSWIDRIYQEYLMAQAANQMAANQPAAKFLNLPSDHVVPGVKIDDTSLIMTDASGNILSSPTTVDFTIHWTRPTDEQLNSARDAGAVARIGLGIIGSPAACASLFPGQTFITAPFSMYYNLSTHASAGQSEMRKWGNIVTETNGILGAVAISAQSGTATVVLSGATEGYVAISSVAIAAPVVAAGAAGVAFGAGINSQLSDTSREIIGDTVYGMGQTIGLWRGL